jgi:hypothetical protein
MDKLLRHFEYDDVGGMIDFSLEKRATASEVADFISSITPDKNKFYLHINAMGAGEYYGNNRNGDYFPEENLKAWHKTFETTPAHVYRHHINKNPEIAIGRVIYSYYNERMHRVELIAELDRERAAPEYLAIVRGEYPQTSMACHTPFDVCSICGNKAHSRSEYCSHLNTQLRQVLSDGRGVYAINSGPLKFFDISIVMRPADVTSSVLQKVAGVEIGSAEMAELEGVEYTPRTSNITKMAIEKFSDLIKNSPGDIVDISDTLQSILKDIKDPDDSLIDDLKGYSLEDIISTLGYLSINPSLEFMLKILVSKYVDGDVSSVAASALSELSARGLSAIPESSKDLVPDIEDHEPNPYLVRTLWRYMDHCSYAMPYVEKRASGYLNWQPGREPVDSSRVRKSSSSLLQLVGGAIIAKMMISNISSALTKFAVKSKYVADVPVLLMDLSLSKDLEKL